MSLALANVNAREQLPACVVPATRALQGVRVLFVVPTLGLGGAERQAFFLAKHLVRHQRASVSFACFAPVGGSARLAAQCEREGIPWTRFTLRHGFQDRVGHAVDALRFARFLRRRRADIVLPYCMFQNVLCALTWRIGGARVCIWNQRDEGRARVSRWVERMAASQIRCFVANAAHGAAFVRDALGAADDRVHVVHNGVMLPKEGGDPAAWRQRLGLPDSAFVGCMLANLQAYKDHETLVRAWRAVVNRLHQDGTDAHLLLVGRADGQHAAIERQVEAQGLSRHVHFLGAVSDVWPLLQSVDLAVFSSRKEGLPNAVLEAMAAGLAVVATDIPGIREAVGPAGMRCLAREGDPHDLAAKIVELARDAPLRRALGRAGRERARVHFSIQRMCEEMTMQIVSQWSGVAARGQR